MSNPATVKIECPACGQHYSLEMASGQTVVSCEKCGAEFTASRVTETQAVEPAAEDSVAPESAPIPTAPLEAPNRSWRNGTSPLDRLQALMWRFGRMFAGLLAVVFLLGLLASGAVFLLNLRSGIEVPTYDQITTGTQTAPGTGGTSRLDERRDIEKRFGDDIAALVKKFGLAESAYDGLVQAVKEIKKPYRKDYLTGLGEALKAGEQARTKSPGAKTLSPGEVAESYTEAFIGAEQQAVTAAETAKTNRWGAVGSAVVCCFLLSMMLVIPALLKIEENTRQP